jgi:hypothetical protein
MTVTGAICHIDIQPGDTGMLGSGSIDAKQRFQSHLSKQSACYDSL